MNFGLNCFPPRTFNQHFSCLYTVMKNLFIFYFSLSLMLRGCVSGVTLTITCVAFILERTSNAMEQQEQQRRASDPWRNSMEDMYRVSFWCVLSSLVIGILIYIYWGLCDALFSFLLRWLEECDGN